MRCSIHCTVGWRKSKIEFEAVRLRQILTKCSKIKQAYEVLFAKWTKKMLCKNILTLHRYRDFRVGSFYCYSIWALNLAIRLTLSYFTSSQAPALHDNVYLLNTLKRQFQCRVYRPTLLRRLRSSRCLLRFGLTYLKSSDKWLLSFCRATGGKRSPRRSGMKNFGYLCWCLLLVMSVCWN